MNIKQTAFLLITLNLLFIFGSSAENPELEKTNSLKNNEFSVHERNLRNNNNNKDLDSIDVKHSENIVYKKEILKIKKQNVLLKMTINQINAQKNNEFIMLYKPPLELTQLEVYKSFQLHSKQLEKPSVVAKKSHTSNIVSVHPSHEPVAITDIDETHFGIQLFQSNKLAKHTQNQQVGMNRNRAFRMINKTSDKSTKETAKSEKNTNESSELNQIGYWQTVHSIESKQGKLLYRPRNKSRSCTYTSGPCGHHQLTVQALKDIGCNSKQCRKDRLNYNKSLKLSKKLLSLNEKRLKKNGISELEDYQKYLIHQQGAYGIKNILAATKGKRELSRKIKKNMANNSPYSFRQLKRMGSKIAAKRFMKHWENKWTSEKRLIVASQPSRSTNSQINADFIPTFDESEIQLALNMRF